MTILFCSFFDLLVKHALLKCDLGCFIVCFAMFCIVIDKLLH